MLLILASPYFRKDKTTLHHTCESVPKFSPPQCFDSFLLGSVKGFSPEPVAWVHQTPAKGKVFYTSLGHEEDFKKGSFQILLKNAVNWCLN